MVDTVFMVAAYALMVASFAGWAAFRVMYRPWRPAGHSIVGRHLIRTADSLLALFGVSLLSALVPLPGPVMQVLTLLILAWLAVVAWERVHLLRQELAAARARKAARVAAADDEDPEITLP